MPRRVLALLRDPLFWFAVLGGSCFAVYAVVADSRHVIEIPPSIRTQLIQDHELLLGRKPGSDELQQLLNHYIDDEVLFRESLREGMHTSDARIKQRLIEKMRFALTSPVSDPSDAELVKFYAEHPRYYDTEPKYVFEQVFFSRQPANAVDVLSRLRAGERVRSDDFWLGERLRAYDESMVRGLLGQAFVASLRAAVRQQWTGPIRSARGWHFVRVEEYIEPHLMQFVDVREQVLHDWLETERTADVESQIAVLKRKYRVKVEF